MNLPPLNIPSLLRTHGLAAKKSLGQNFLTDPGALKRIVEAAEVNADSEVLEIGPGLGSLTRFLAASARHVTAVELDYTLLPALSDVLSGFDNVQVIHGDILELNPAELMPVSDYLVVANIPYYITSAVFRHLLESGKRPRRMVLTVQREVAERICAGPGDLSLLALSVQVYGVPRIAARIPAGAFFPPPKVDSAVVRVDLHPQPAIPEGQLELFFQLIKAGFSQKRKTLRNSLSAGLHIPADQAVEMLTAAGIDPQRRAETVSIAEWGALTAYAAAQRSK